MKTHAHSTFITTCFVLVLATSSARADGLSDLKGSLARLQGTTPIKARVDVNFAKRGGEGKKTDETKAQFNLNIEEGIRGLQLLYSKELIAKLDAEEFENEKNSKTKTPTLTAFNDVKAATFRLLLSANSALIQRLKKATLKSEAVDTLNGKTVRVLSFDVPIESIDVEERDRFKKFESNFKVWIADDGTPLAYRSSVYSKVSLILMMSMEMKNQEDYQYGVVGDRLVIQKAENKSSIVNMAMNQETTIIKTLTTI